MSSIQEEKPPVDISTKLREMRNTDLVSRLLAATPPYLYSALPLQPHAFFFSEMLRSFVNARHGCRPSYHRRFKRRSQKYFAENEDWRREYKEDEKKEETRPEPLELTVEKQPRIPETSPRRLSPKEKPASPRQSTFVDVGTEDLPKPSPCLRSQENTASNLILPPPPPMWYPPLYNPQFGVDPLNFFIDLRVSGHIYDRKRAMEGVETNLNTEHDGDKRLSSFGRPRHLSAFSVPVRNAEAQQVFETNRQTVNGTSYIMKNLKNVYENLHTKETDTKRDKGEERHESSDVEEDIID